MRPKPDEASAVIARSEATKQSILSPSGAMDCFASLAMTGMVRGASNVIRHPGMNALAFTLRWPCAARPSKRDGPRPLILRARSARASSDNGEAVARG
jgi:hypothetical protein